MEFTKRNAIIVLAATLFPFVDIVLFVVIGINVAIVGLEDSRWELVLRVLFALHVITFIWIIGLMAFYLLFICKSPKILNVDKNAWIIAILSTSVFAMLVVWHRYIWESPHSAGTTKDNISRNS